MREKKSSAVPALDRGKRVLDTISTNGRPMGIAELSRTLDLPKSTVHGLCHTLTDLGLLMRVDPAMYAIGPHVLTWAHAFDASSDLTREFAQVTENGDFDPRRSINLSILSGRDVMYVACRRGADPLGISFSRGAKLPAVFTATGKAMFSTMSDVQIQNILGNEWPQPWTDHSVSSFADLQQELEAVRSRGYSIDNGQLKNAMVCFGAPIFAAGNEVAIAGVAIGLLASELNESVEREVIRTVSNIAQKVSGRLGASISRTSQVRKVSR